MGKYTVTELRDYCKQGQKIYIDGIGVKSAKVLYNLLSACIPVVGFIVDSLESIAVDNLYGLPICKVAEGIVVEELVKEEFAIKEKWNMALMLTMLNSRFHNRPVVFMVHEAMRDFWINVIATMKLEDASVISVENEMDEIYELCYKDMERLIVAITTSDMEEEVAENLILLGLEETKNILYIHNSFSGNFTSEYKGFDWMLGNTYDPESSFPGFCEYRSFGNESEEGAFKIVVLGNSATDPFFYRQISWPEYLCRFYREKRMKCIIWNGAITDYSSGNELTKLLRDAVHLSPDIIISYSGVIDFRDYKQGYPFINLNLKRTMEVWCGTNPKKNLVLGVKDERTAYRRWLQNEEIMHAACSTLGIRFLGVLQPWIGSGISGDNEYLRAWYYNYWRIVYPEFKDYLYNAEEFARQIKDDSEKLTWLHDFTHIFDSYWPDEIYYDSVHVNEKGNQIVARHMMDLLGN